MNIVINNHYAICQKMYQFSAPRAGGVLRIGLNFYIATIYQFSLTILNGVYEFRRKHGLANFAELFIGLRRLGCKVSTMKNYLHIKVSIPIHNSNVADS